MNKVRPEVVSEQIKSFEKRFGEAHLYLAYHGAFPLALTPDLLYRLWAKFQQDIHGEVLDIPWIAVADLLLSSLCHEVGHELYEMVLPIRNELLKRLKEDRRFGQQRIGELSEFLLQYAQQLLYSHDPDTRDFAQLQQWIALSYTRPSEASYELALTLSKTYHSDRSDLIRLTSLVETLAEPLAELEDFQPLLMYARGMGYFVGGDIEAAKKELGKASRKNEIKVAGVSLPIPEQLKAINNLSRRKVIQYLGWGSVGLGLATGGYQLQRSPQPKPQPTSTASPAPTPEVVTLQTAQFEVVTVNERGEIINRRPSQANFFTEDLGNGITLEMVEIPGGQFVMGSPANERQRESDESPQHTVTIRPFFMSRFTVTQEQYQAVMGNNPSRFQEKGEKRPVETVSWDEATQFCDKLSSRTGKSYRYRLPSEAEWEYACRAGTTTPFHFGETITSELANYDGSVTYASEPEGQYRQQTTEVGIFPPNAFGLYDMHGNVYEWCLDTWHDNYNGAPTDGRAWITSNNDNQSLLLRGGSWFNGPRDCRSANRFRYPRGYRLSFVGFRVVVAVLRT